MSFPRPTPEELLEHQTAYEKMLSDALNESNRAIAEFSLHPGCPKYRHAVDAARIKYEHAFHNAQIVREGIKKGQIVLA